MAQDDSKYTKPGLRKRIFNQVKAGSSGGKPGQWSARKAQLVAQKYKKAGGGLGGADRTNNPEADAFLKMYLDLVDNKDDYLK